jgi:ABC-2 type transport system permease protein
MAISSNAVKRASEIILTFNAGAEIHMLEGKGFTSKEAENMALPLKFVYQQVVNPSGTFYDFLLWGLIGAIAHFPIMVFAAGSFSDEEKKETTFYWGVKNCALFHSRIFSLLFLYCWLFVIPT